MDEREAVTLIYHSGFSTASVVSDISGRGIGMDIVRSVVEGMRGSIRIRTELGAGASFILRFPLTLAIIRGIIFRIGTRLFALPLGAVREIIRVFGNDIERVGGRGSGEVPQQGFVAPPPSRRGSGEGEEEGYPDPRRLAWVPRRGRGLTRRVS